MEDGKGGRISESLGGYRTFFVEDGVYEVLLLIVRGVRDCCTRLIDNRYGRGLFTIDFHNGRSPYVLLVEMEKIKLARIC